MPKKSKRIAFSSFQLLECVRTNPLTYSNVSNQPSFKQKINIYHGEKSCRIWQRPRGETGGASASIHFRLSCDLLFFRRWPRLRTVPGNANPLNSRLQSSHKRLYMPTILRRIGVSLYPRLTRLLLHFGHCFPIIIRPVSLV